MGVTILNQNGANSTFSNDTYLGIRFHASEFDGGTVFLHEWAYSGVTETRLIRTRTRVLSKLTLTDSNIKAEQKEPINARNLRRPSFKDHGFLWNIALIFSILFFSILFIYGVRYMYRMIRGIFQHRRACRFNANLVTGTNKLEGMVTIFGLTGCRFQPIDNATRSRLQKILAEGDFSEFNIMVAGETLPVFVDGFHKYFSPLYFIEPISRIELDDLLQHSMIKPYLVPRIGHKTTRKKWRANIIERQLKIQSLRDSR